MIVINKEEKEAINARFPGVHIVRTMKGRSKRHNYYCEETRRVTKLLNEMSKSYGAVYSKGGVMN